MPMTVVKAWKVMRAACGGNIPTEPAGTTELYRAATVLQNALPKLYSAILGSDLLLNVWCYEREVSHG